jgi:hypothetical protein
MPQVTVIKPFWWRSHIWYGVGQYQLGGEGWDAWLLGHCVNGQPDPPGTPFDNPGTAIICTTPPNADGTWPG